MLTFVLRSLGSLFDVLRKQKDQFKFALLLLFVSAATFSLGGIGYSIEDVLLIYGVSTFSVLGYRVVWILMQVNIAKQSIINVVLDVILDLCIYAIPVYLFVRFTDANSISILLLATIVVVIYFIIKIYRDNYLRNMFIALFNKQQVNNEIR